MPRQPRTDYPGALHHVFTRAVPRTLMAADEADYRRVLALLERTVSRFELTCHAWCLMPNHAHFVVTSRLGNLSRAMHWLGTCTAQKFNSRHERYGHLYQGRFGSRLIESDDHLLELARYLPLNPVKAGLCTAPDEWPWSSYAASADLSEPPCFLDSQILLDALGSSRSYVAWVADGVLATSLDEHGAPLPPPKPALESLIAEDSDRAIAHAHFWHGYSKAAIGRHLGINRSQVGRRLDRLGR
jgi:putative transposase